MNAERLLAHYERISDAPDAMARLRRFILDLAVRGKLVSQNWKDEPASELLKRIAAEKARLLKAGEIRTPKWTSAGSEPPFPIPANWRWSQIAEVGVLNPRNEAPDDAKVSFVPMPLIPAEYGAANEHEVRPWGEIKKGYTHFSEGDVGLAKITPCFENGKSTVFRNLTGGIGSGTTELHIVRPVFVDQHYILIFFKSPHFIETGISKMTGTAGQKRVPTEYFAHSPFPVPPLAEQHRIVAKVNELMALCDQIEAARTVREASRDRLMAASLARLNSPASDRSTFVAHARFALNNLAAITARVDQVKQLRHTILSLAVRGKLVPQNPNDEPASQLLERIAADRAQFVKDGRIPALKPLPAPLGVQLPFKLPANWQWASFGELVEDADAGWSPRTEGFPRSGDFWGVLKVSAVSWDRFLPEENKQLLPDVVPPDSAKVHQGDFLISRANTSELVAKCVVVESDPRNLILSDKIVRLRLSKESNKKYLCIVNNSSDHARAYYAAHASGTSLSMKNVSRSIIYSLPVPIPPLAEQDRIVAKVDELMALCDRLEASLAASDGQRSRLLDAFLAEALASAEGARPAEELELAVHG